MTVRDMMRTSPKYCAPTANLAAVTELLWSSGGGALPVIDAGGKIVGIVTDRDVCVAVGTRNLRPSELTAAQAMSHPVAVCQSGDDIHAALKIMRAKKVRRLPVTGDSGKLEGILCLTDLILHARHDDGSGPALSYEDVMGALKGIYWRHSSALAATR